MNVAQVPGEVIAGKSELSVVEWKLGVKEEERVSAERTSVFYA
jgi:hypothetical protein